MDLTLYCQLTFSVIIIVVLHFLSVNTMSERSYNLRPRARNRSQSETRPSFGHEPSTPTGRTESPTTLTDEKRPAPGQHPVPEVVGIAPRSEMKSRPVFSIATVAVAECTLLLFLEVNTTIIKMMQSAMLCYQYNTTMYLIYTKVKVMTHDLV